MPSQPCESCGDAFYSEEDRRSLQGACPRCLARQVLDETTQVPEESALVPAGPALQNGTDFQGYEILDPLGKGGMGTVYRARQKSLGRRIALKILSPRLARSEEFIVRFRREAKLLAALNHPNIVRVYDFGEAEGLPWLGMEFVEGTTLDSAFRARSLPVSALLSLLARTCRGLDAIHRAGLVHRDLKPANLMITPEGEPKIADFGLAVPTTDSLNLTETGSVLGTPAYMSPEQVLGKKIDGRSDLYSLGIILYEGLTRRLPFEGATPTAVLLKHIEDPPPSPRTFVPELPADLEELTLKLLSKDPARRPESAEALRLLLERAARKARTREQGGFRVRGAALPVAVALLAAAAGFLVGRGSAAPAPPPADGSATATASPRDPSIQDFDLRKLTWKDLSPVQRFGWDDSARRMICRAGGPGALPLAIYDPGDFDLYLAAAGGGTSAEYAKFRLAVDGTAVGDEQSCDSRPKIFRFRAALGPSTRKLSIEFTNPGDTIPPQDRVLFLYGLRMVPAGTPEPEATGGLLPETASSAPSVNVLAALRTTDHALQGEWTFEGAHLLPQSQVHQRATLGLPFLPPDEYDLECSVLPLQKPLGGLEIGLVSGASRFVVTLDGGRGAVPVSGIAMADGDAGPRHEGVVLRNARENTVLCEVRKDGVRVSVNRALVASWSGPRERLRLDPRIWNLPENAGLFLSSRIGRYRFSSVRLRPAGSGGPVVARPFTVPVPAGDRGTALLDQAGRVRGVAFGAEKGRLVSGGDDGVLRLWDFEWGRVVRTFEGHTGAIETVACAPAGAVACTGGADHTAIVWNLDNGRALWRLAHEDPVTAAVFLPDGRTLVTAAGAALKRWDLKTGASLGTLEHGGAVRSMALSPDGKRILSAGGTSGIRIWDAESGSLLGQAASAGGELRAAFFTPDGAGVTAAFADGTIRLWEAGAGWRGAGSAPPGITDLARSPDGKTLVYCKGDAVLIDADGSELQRLAGHQYMTTRAAFSPDGRHIATAGEDGTVGLWTVHARWAPLFDHEGLGFARPGAESQWEVSSGALVPKPGSETLTLESAQEIPDGLVRIRFTVGSLDWMSVRLREEGEGSAGVYWFRTQRPPPAVVNELLLRSEGGDTTATLNGAPVLVQWDGQPKKRKLELRCSAGVEGLRILAVDFRPSPPGPPKAAAEEGLSIGVTPSLSRGLSLVRQPDGEFALDFDHGMPCVILLPNGSPNRYLYVAIADRSLVTPRAEVVVDYLDEGSGEFGLEYDGVQGPYSNAWDSVRLEDSGVWKSARFVLQGPAFRGRQNGKCDLRLARAPGAPLKIQGIRLEYHEIRSSRPPDGPVAKPDDAQPGLMVEYFEGSWDSVVRIKAQKPVSTGVAAVPALPEPHRSEDFALRFTGYVEIPKDGDYIFSTISDDGSDLILGGRRVVDNDGLHGTEAAFGTEQLRAGFYTLRLDYFQKKGGALLEVYWAGPGIPHQRIPASALFHVPKTKSAQK